MTFALRGRRAVLSCLALVAGAIPGFAADWRKELGTFRIGMVESRISALSPAELSKMQAAYAAALGMPVEVIPARDFPSLIDSIASSRIEYAVFSAAAYATAAIACDCVEPLVGPVAADGSTGEKVVLMAAAGQTVASLPASKGVALPLEGGVTLTGIVLAELIPGGRKLEGGETWLKPQSGSDAAVAAFSTGAVDAFVTMVPSNRTLETAVSATDGLALALAAGGRAANPVWMSSEVPYGPHAVRRNLAPEARKALLDFLVNVHGADPALAELLLPDMMVSFHPAIAQSFAGTLNAVKAAASSAAAP